MNFYLSESRNIKLAAIILLAGYFFSLFLFNGMADEFAPMHTAIIQESADKGSISQKDSLQIPGFYSYGILFIKLGHLDSLNLLYYPIQIIPHMIVFFLLCYIISNNYLISSLVTFLDSIMGTGTFRDYFWCHGIGFILFAIMIICIIKNMYSLYQNDFSKAKIFDILSIIVGSSLIFISYDYFAIFVFFLITLIFLFIFLLILCLNKIEFIQTSFDKYIKSLLILFIILNTIEIFIHGFISNIFIPSVEQMQNTPISVTEKFLSQYFSSETIISPLKDQLFTSTPFITTISLIKYLILMLFIIICIYQIFYYIFLKKISMTEIFLIAFILSSTIYAISRMIVFREIMFDYMFVPGILCMMWVYKNSLKLRNFVLITLIFLIFLTQLYYFENLVNEKYNVNKSNFNDDQFVAQWYFDYLRGLRTSSDVYTYYLIFLYNQKYSKQLGIDNDFRNNTIMPIDSVLFLVQKSNNIPKNNVFFINYRLNSLALLDWIRLKSWNYSKKQIEENVNLNKIYYGNDIGIYSISKKII